MKDLKPIETGYSNRSFINKVYKLCLRFIVGFIFIAIALFFMLPSIASSSFGTKKIQSYLSGKINGEVIVESLHFTVWGHQEIRGLKILDREGHLVLTSASILLETSLPELLLQGALEHPVKFFDLNLIVEKLATGTTNIQNLLESKEVEVPKLSSPIALNHINGEVQFSDDLFVFKLEGLSAKEDLKGKFHFDILLTNDPSKQLIHLLSHPQMLLSELSKLNLDLEATNFPVELLDLLLAAKTDRYRPDLLVSTLGKTLDLTLHQSKIAGEKNLFLELSAKAGDLSANITGGLEDGKFFITNQSTFNFAFNQTLIDYLFTKDFGMRLANQATVFIDIEELSLPFDLKSENYDLLNLTFKGKVDLQASLVSQTGLPDIDLKKMTAIIETDEQKEEWTLKIAGEAFQRNLPINIAIETVLPKSLDFKKHKFPPLKIHLTHIPVAILDHFFGMDQTLSNAIGTHADLKIEALLHHDELDLQLEFDSEKLSIPSIFVKIDEQIKLMKPSTLHYRVDEATAKKLLPQNAIFSFNTDKPLSLTFSFDPIENVDEIASLLKVPFSGDMNIHDFSFNLKETNEILSIQDLYIPWEIHLDQRKAEVAFSGKTKYLSKAEGLFSGNASFKKEEDNHLFDILIKQKNAKGDNSQIKVEGNIEKLFGDNKELNTQDLKLDLKAVVDHLPTPLFCKVACLDLAMHKKIEVLFGDFLSADVHLALKGLNGLVQATVSGADGSFSLDSYINDGSLFLNQPFQAKFKASPRLGKSILHDIFPFLSGVVSSDQPILIAIAHEGFVFPLTQLDVSKIEIPQAILSLGHVKFDNSGELANVLSLLTPPDTDLISVWFTPLYFNMHEGIFKLERVDMLISHRFPIATWGKIDLLQDKVKMTIGMSGYALTHAFKIKGLDNEYMVQIPLIGTTSSATIDKVNATTKIGALIATGQGGPKGLVLGTVLSLAGGALTEEKPPKSTTLPLPWAEELKEFNVVTEDQAEASEPIAETDPQAPQKKKRKKKGKFQLDKALEYQLKHALDLP